MKQQTIRFAATGARVATGAVVAAACVFGVLTAVAAPWPEVRTAPAGTKVAPVPADALLVCDGSFRVLGRDASQAGLMVSAATPRLRIDGAADQAKTAPLDQSDVTGGGGAQSITAKVKDRAVPQVAASESVTIDAEDASGFAAAPCREPSLNSWLIGGDVSTGASDVIVLSNPGAVTATVTLDVYGESRRASTVLVPAMTQLGVPLASVAAGERSPIVRATSAGAPIRASLQSTLVRTLDAVGIDVQDGVSGAQNGLRILGIRSAPITDGDDASGLVVRMLAPDADGSATVRVRSASSAEIIAEYPVDLVAATPAEIALAGLPEGYYDIEIESSAQLVAGVHQTARAGAREDFAWMLPAPELAPEAELAFSVPTGAPATLFLRNPGDAEVTVTIDGADRKQVQLPAGGGAVVPVRAGGHTLLPSGRVHAAIGMGGESGSAAVAGWPLWGGAATDRPILVRP
jgi:hypothetical protein